MISCDDGAVRSDRFKPGTAVPDIDSGHSHEPPPLLFGNGGMRALRTTASAAPLRFDSIRVGPVKKRKKPSRSGVTAFRFASAEGTGLEPAIHFWTTDFESAC